jgi:hypothetical protein
MAQKQIRIERLLGRRVRDSAGRSAGRIEDFRALFRNGDCVVEEYLLGTSGLFQRLSIAGFAMSLLRFLGARTQWLCRVPWDMMDLSNPQKPRLRCRREELKS